jgi:EmrB/QacA subfamily drug resistance transporter
MTRKWTPLVAVCLGTFMLLIDVTIVNVALPDMSRDLHTSFSELQWVVDIYALVLAALMLGIGSVADIAGRRRVYVGGLVLFAVGSLASGVAPNAALLITARGVQGVGAAAMFATTIALLNTSYTGRDRGTAFGIWGAVSGGAAAVGPILGGVLTSGLSWRWIFFVNLPVSVLAVSLSLRVLSETRREGRPRVDLAGSATFTLASAALTYALIRVSSVGWGSAQTLGLLAVTVVALVAFVAVELRTSDPMLDLGLMRSGSFVAVMVGAVLLSCSAFAGLTYSSIWLQTALGLGPISAGLVFLPLSAAAFIVSASAGRFLHSSPRGTIGVGLLLIGAGGLLQGTLDSHAGWGSLIAGLAVTGVGVGLATPTLASAAMGAVAPERGGMAAGAVTTARQLGYALGIAILGSIFQSRITHVVSADGRVPHAHAVALALGSGEGGALRRVLPPAPAAHLLRQAFATGLDSVYLVSGIAGLAAGALALALVRNSPQRGAAQPAPPTVSAAAAREPSAAGNAS